MTRRRHTPDQIFRKLAEGNKLLAAGQELDVVCRHLQIADRAHLKLPDLLQRNSLRTWCRNQSDGSKDPICHPIYSPIPDTTG